MVINPTAEDRLLEGNEDAAVTVARHVAELDYGGLDAENLAAVKRLTLDCLGAGVAGVEEPGCVETRELVEEWGGAAQASLIGSGTRVPVHSAVMANSTTCRALEIDDVSEAALIHTTATVVPVALAAAEAQPGPVSGRDLAVAIAAGVDVANRISSAPRHHVAGPGYRIRGMSYTYQVGTMAAAAVVAKLAGASPGQVLSALGMAYSNAAGNQQVLADHALAVRVQQGLSAANGVVAAQLALRGVTGPHHPLEGKFGYYPIYCHDDYDRDKVVAGIGERLTVVDVSIKPYPCCKYTHTGVAAALEARSNPRFEPAQVERVVLRVDNAEYFSVVCDPVEAKRRPTTPVEAQFSMHYCVALALVRGELRLEDFRPEALGDPTVLAMANKVECVVGPGENRGRKLPTPGHTEVHLAGGFVITGDAEYAPGHPARPFSWDDTVLKFMRCVAFPARPLPEAKAKALVYCIASLEHLEDIRGLVRSHLAW